MKTTPFTFSFFYLLFFSMVRGSWLGSGAAILRLACAAAVRYIWNEVGEAAREAGGMDEDRIHGKVLV